MSTAFLPETGNFPANPNAYSFSPDSFSKNIFPFQDDKKVFYKLQKLKKIASFS